MAEDVRDNEWQLIDMENANLASEKTAGPSATPECHGDAVPTKTYAAATEVSRTEGTKPIFMKENDFFGDFRPTKEQWLTHVELYKAIGKVINKERIGGIQRVGGLWRIYIDNDIDRAKLLTSGFALRSKHVSLLSLNPYRLPVEGTIRVRVKNVPLSADDGQISRALELAGCEIVSQPYREKLRVDNKLTNCETGDRIISVAESSLAKPLPRQMLIGKYKASVIHYGQQRQFVKLPNKTCSKCLEDGHLRADCENDWRCRSCMQFGHKQYECSADFEESGKSPRGAPQSTDHNDQSASESHAAQPHASEIKEAHSSGDTHGLVETTVQVHADKDGLTAVKAKAVPQEKLAGERRARRHKSGGKTRRRQRSPPTPSEVMNPVHKRAKDITSGKDPHASSAYDASTDTESEYY